jgi:hypothetical protein
MKLQLGKMSSKDIAAWFGLSYSSLKNRSAKFYGILADYCNYEKVHGGVIISEIYMDEYDKKLNLKDKQKYLEEIQECVKTQDGLSTISGMVRKFNNEGYEFSSQKTGERRMRKAGEVLFGTTKDLISHGEAGTREYVWGIKLTDFNKYRLMTEEEEKLFDSIIKETY